MQDINGEIKSNYHNYTSAVGSGKKAMQEVILNWYNQISKIHNIYHPKNWDLHQSQKFLASF